MALFFLLPLSSLFCGLECNAISPCRFTYPLCYNRPQNEYLGGVTMSLADLHLWSCVAVADASCDKNLKVSAPSLQPMCPRNADLFGGTSNQSRCR